MKQIHIYCKNLDSPYDGVFFIEVDGKCFPADDWFDIPISVIYMWCYNLHEFITHPKQKVCELYFMDGPYSLRLRRRSAESIHLVLLRMAQEEPIGEIDIQSFVQTVWNTAEMLLNYSLTPNCPKCNIADIKKLRKEISKRERLTIKNHDT